MAEPVPIQVVATHEIRERSTTVPPGTPGEITAMTGSCPTYYTVSFCPTGSNERVTIGHLSRLDIHEA